MFLPAIGLVDGNKLKPDDIVGVNKDSYLVLSMLPAESVHFVSKKFRILFVGEL